MKMKLLFIAMLAVQISAFSQPCLPEGITFTIQAQIDNFQTNYPDCTEIEGDVYIWGDDIINVDGLNILTSIDGNLGIGFDEGGGGGNPILNSLEGFGNLITIGGDLEFFANDGLENLSGLDNLTSIGGTFLIESNSAMSSLTGLESLLTIGGNLTIYYTQSLLSLTGLNNLTSIGGDVSIFDNEALATLSGLDNLNVASINTLYISNNPSLSDCEVESLCNYLSSPTGEVNIYNNAIGCNNPGEIAISCGFALPCLPYGNYHLFSQSEIDNFETNYPDCHDLAVEVWIGNWSMTDISNLFGLYAVTSISGNLLINNTEFLTSLSGLDNITSISGGLSIGSDFWILNGNKGITNLTGLDNLVTIGGGLTIADNDELTNLAGLENLISIGGELQIGGNPSLTSLNGLENLALIEGELHILYNGSLNDLTGLSNVTSIGGDLNIHDSEALTSLSGLENIAAGSIDGLYLHDNISLTTCEVQSICDYLISPSGTFDIHDNAPGCNSTEEVQQACDTASNIVEFNSQNTFVISPNPLSSNALLEYTLHQSSPAILQIIDISGQEIITIVNETQQKGVNKVVIDGTKIKAGIYFCVLKTNEGIQTTKLIKL